MKKNIIIITIFLSFTSIILNGMSPEQITIGDIKPKNVEVAEEIEVVSKRNVIDIIKEAFPRFYALLVKTRYASEIERASAVTIFAPTNAAFDKLINLIGKNAYDEIFNKTYTQEGMQKLERVLKLHIAPSRELAYDLMSLKAVQPLDKGKLSADSDVIKINETTAIIEADIIGTNGVVRAIDAVLMP